jgi:hypothetical protein
MSRSSLTCDRNSAIFRLIGYAVNAAATKTLAESTFSLRQQLGFNNLFALNSVGY